MKKILYHGSINKFDKFSLETIGIGSGTTGAGYGLYFSDNKADALAYGPVIYECEVNLKNNISNTKVTFTEASLISLISRIEVETGKNYFQHYETTEEAIKSLLQYNYSDTEIISDIVNGSFGGISKWVLEILTEIGYNHTIDEVSPEGNFIHYILYDVDSIRIKNVETIKDL